ncbi:hypothetical protein MMC25_001352 [Agyrium rufum]|nr:hypothetical protein [Agyrium rufum]
MLSRAGLLLIACLALPSVIAVPKAKSTSTSHSTSHTTTHTTTHTTSHSTSHTSTKTTKKTTATSTHTAPTATTTVTHVGKYWPGWSKITKFFPFGDSYTTTGFNVSLTQPGPGNPLGNPPYPGYTSSNGPNWVDFLTTTYNQSFLETYNLAYGGATVDSSLVAQYLPTVLDFVQQVNDEFIPYYVKKNTAGWTSENSLFAAFFGINDVGNSYGSGNTTLNGDIFVVYAQLVDQLYQSGARNFLFLNVPPVNLSPGTTIYGQGAINSEGADIEAFNLGIERLATNLSIAYPDTTVFQFDTNAVFSQVLDEPSSYPETALYKNTTAYCVAYENGTPAEDTFNATCGIPVNQYFWLNTLHPTYPMQQVIAKEVAAELTA